jgi:hypothetical protein
VGAPAERRDVSRADLDAAVRDALSALDASRAEVAHARATLRALMAWLGGLACVLGAAIIGGTSGISSIWPHSAVAGAVLVVGGFLLTVGGLTRRFGVRRVGAVLCLLGYASVAVACVLYDQPLLRVLTYGGFTVGMALLASRWHVAHEL